MTGPHRAPKGVNDGVEHHHENPAAAGDSVEPEERISVRHTPGMPITVLILIVSQGSALDNLRTRFLLPIDLSHLCKNHGE
jgi:hypothetical protein